MTHDGDPGFEVTSFFPAPSSWFNVISESCSTLCEQTQAVIADPVTSRSSALLLFILDERKKKKQKARKTNRNENKIKFVVWRRMSDEEKKDAVPQDKDEAEEVKSTEPEVLRDPGMEKAARMLGKFGYSAGVGLGATGQGIATPLEIASQTGRQGLGFALSPPLFFDLCPDH